MSRQPRPNAMPARFTVEAASRSQVRVSDWKADRFNMPAARPTASIPTTRHHQSTGGLTSARNSSDPDANPQPLTTTNCTSFFCNRIAEMRTDATSPKPTARK